MILSTPYPSLLMATKKTPSRSHPILFSEEMVKALADGRKTVTRRTSGLKEINLHPEQYVLLFLKVVNEVTWASFWNPTTEETFKIRCPFGIPGHTIWVRETYASGFSGHVSTCGYLYKATDVNRESHHGKWCYQKNGKYFDHYDRQFKWTPNIHMKKTASRFEYEVESIHIERIQEITEKDAQAEGVNFSVPCYYDPADSSLNTIREDNRGIERFATVQGARAHFAFLINTLHKHKDPVARMKGPWDRNVWVWVIRFKIIQEPQND